MGKEDLDQIDKDLLNLIQEEFPLEERPFLEIGKRLGLTEDEAYLRVKNLKEKGFIRRIGPVLERKNLKLKSFLCGAYVEDSRLEEVANEINKHRGVTHNYERDGNPNLWFTISGESLEEIERFLEDIEKRFNIKIYRFPEKRVFKIKTVFPL
ncbi:MAG: AsnC family transcriptional regulator [Desulfobacterota bacterium]|nr:AsnC family transcriptional regulator [Thermodesulfobacteriota bacterium]MDW8001467.1 AsnC family transcriptional regulator [Deltaproteobacteria bacterium]